MKRKGCLVVISGFSGAGKGTIVKKLMKQYEGEYALSVSMTTRQPRPGEVDGREYFFVTKERFEQEIASNGLLEYAGYVDNYYGTPRKYVEEKMAEGKDVILEIEVQGAKQIKQIFPEAVLLFVTTPSAEILKERLVGRGTESEEKIAQRLLQAATREAPAIPDYDYLIVNDELDECIAHVRSVIESARSAPMRRRDFVAQFMKDLRSFAEREARKPEQV
ncbi:MAG: guanylate kinase [Eubacteriales bacterium]|nr:guanylate kinase [Eubacteriales bacterium]